MAVQEALVEWALVPIENSIEGSVTVTLDTLGGAGRRRGDRRRGGVPGAPLSDRARADRARADRDCRLPPTRTRPVPALPARASPTCPCHGGKLDSRGGATGGRAHRRRSPRWRERGQWAAIGTRLAAGLYGCTVIAEGIQDREDNETRFVWLRAQGQRLLDRRRSARRRALVARLRSCSGERARTRPGGWCCAWTSSPGVTST